MPLSEQAVAARLTELAGWTGDGTGIHKTYAFDSFRDAVGFVNAVAQAAEEMQHHPDIDIRYDRVTLRSVSHDVGGVTERDFRLARRAELAAGGPA